MDPVSITGFCIGIFTAFQQISGCISRLIDRVKCCGNDLDDAYSHLEDLREVLADLGERGGCQGSLAEEIRKRRRACRRCVHDLRLCLKTYSSGKLCRLRWAARGKKEVEDLGNELGRRIATLALLLQDSTHTTILDVKRDTSHIPLIRQNTDEIKEQISRLTIKVHQLAKSGPSAGSHAQSSFSFTLKSPFRRVRFALPEEPRTVYPRPRRSLKTDDKASVASYSSDTSKGASEDASYDNSDDVSHDASEGVSEDDERSLHSYTDEEEKDDDEGSRSSHGSYASSEDPEGSAGFLSDTEKKVSKDRTAFRRMLGKFFAKKPAGRSVSKDQEPSDRGSTDHDSGTGDDESVASNRADGRRTPPL